MPWIQERLFCSILNDSTSACLVAVMTLCWESTLFHARLLCSHAKLLPSQCQFAVSSIEYNSLRIRVEFLLDIQSLLTKNLPQIEDQIAWKDNWFSFFFWHIEALCLIECLRTAECNNNNNNRNNVGWSSRRLLWWICIWILIYIEVPIK